MVTYAQLERESWWVREIVTPELDQLGDWVREHYDLAADAIGNRGNNVHLNGSHRSDEWITNSQYCTNRSYTHQTGLTADQRRLIAAIDITPKTTADMLAMSQRIDRAVRTGLLEEVVYWYGNLGGDQRVDGYNNIRNVAATSDASHLWHLHLSLDRRVLRDITVMRRIFAVLTGTRTDVDDMTVDPKSDFTGPLTQGTPAYAGQQRDTALAFIWQGVDTANSYLAEARIADFSQNATLTTLLNILQSATAQGGTPLDTAAVKAAIAAEHETTRALLVDQHGAEMAELQKQHAAETAGLRAELATLGG